MNGHLNHLTDANNQQHDGDIFLINADAAWFRGKVFNRPQYNADRLSQMNWTMGYLTFYLGLNCKISEVYHHNYYLGNNFEVYAKNVMKHPDALQKPYYYVNVLSRSNVDCAPPGCESLFFVCPVPNLYFKDKWDDKQHITDSIINDSPKGLVRI